MIPFTYKLKNSTNQLIWMNLSDSFIELPYKENKDKWIFGNLEFMGYYRVNYDEQNWVKIIEQLKTDHTVFTPVERASLIFDAFTLARFAQIFLMSYKTQTLTYFTF